jgi:hypothetical protein
MGLRRGKVMGSYTCDRMTAAPSCVRPGSDVEIADRRRPVPPVHQPRHKGQAIQNTEHVEQRRVTVDGGEINTPRPTGPRRYVEPTVT